MPDLLSAATTRKVTPSDSPRTTTDEPSLSTRSLVFLIGASTGTCRGSNSDAITTLQRTDKKAALVAFAYHQRRAPI